jgi:dipeptidyl aminopeptidase/acylaminoacyl peptidase
MPHGGPSARDTWGFDWLPQYFAQLGYAVIQPNYRGSSGYGDVWYGEDGFKAWRTAMSDVNDSARWAIAQGIADPKKVAIVGWSYGGYAALQTNVIEPGLYRAAVAIAPLTDMQMWKAEFRGFINRTVQAEYIGSGPHLVEGSPLRNAAAIKVPVMLFHGTRDINVGVAQSEAMASALRNAGGQVELVTYKNLDHQLADSAARADMLLKSARFLEANLK